MKKISNSKYKLKLFRTENNSFYIGQNEFKIQNKNKTIYESYIPLDSKIEQNFAKDCDSREEVNFYFKLPRWFKIKTPIGNYSPDWAIFLEKNKKIYLIAETKGSDNFSQLRKIESQKINCAKKHFQILNNVIYKSGSTLSKIIEKSL